MRSITQFGVAYLRCEASNMRAMRCELAAAACCASRAVCSAWVAVCWAWLAAAWAASALRIAWSVSDMDAPWLAQPAMTATVPATTADFSMVLIIVRLLEWNFHLPVFPRPGQQQLSTAFGQTSSTKARRYKIRPAWCCRLLVVSRYTAVP